MKTITVFGSSKPTPDDPLYLQAYDLGYSLARAGFTVCNGGYGGTMEGSAKGTIEAGGKSIGVLCEAFGTIPNKYIEETHFSQTHSERLHKLIALGDGYVILKGSTGTLVELALVWEYMNKSIIQDKPIVTLGDFWNPVVASLKEELTFEGKEFATRYVTSVHSIESCVSVLLQRIQV